MDIVLRQNGGEVGRFGLTTNKSDTQTNDVIKIVKNGTTYYGRLTSNKPNTTRKLKVTKNGRTLYLQTDPVGLRWAGTLYFSRNTITDPVEFDTVIASNIQYPKGVYRITVVSTRVIDGERYTKTGVKDFTVVQGDIGDFHVRRVRNSNQGFNHQIWCGGFGYFNEERTLYNIQDVTVEKIG